MAGMMAVTGWLTGHAAEGLSCAVPLFFVCLVIALADPTPRNPYSRRAPGERIQPPQTPAEHALEAALRAAYEADGWTDPEVLNMVLDHAQLFRRQRRGIATLTD
jgi:hypothetical protein